jgi:hypothetical protein
MKGKRSVVVKTTACIMLAGGLVAVASVSLSGGPAFAASPNEAYAASASGLVSISPVAEATYPGTSPGSVASISSGTLITAGAVTDTADATDASSTIANLNVGLSALVALTSDDVASSCSFDTNTDTVSGATTITNGSIDLTPLDTIALTSNPAPNTTVAGLGSLATIVLNQQTTAGDGTLTVNALAITIAGQTLTVGTSVCNDASLAPVPALPGIAKPIGLGVAGLVGLGGVGFYFRRLRRLTSQG